MKRLAFCLILILLFSSCSKPNEDNIAEIDTSINNANVSVNYLSTDFMAVVNNKDTVANILITSPEELKGVLITASLDKITLKYGEIELDYTKVKAAEKCPFLKLAKALRIADNSQPTNIIKDKNTLIYEFAQENEKYKIKADRKTHKIFCIEADSVQFNISDNADTTTAE